MLIDCDACAVRGPACDDCVVSVLLAGPATHVHGGPPGELAGQLPGQLSGQLSGEVGGEVAAAVPRTTAELDAAERAAIAVLAGCGLVPPLRLVPLDPPSDGPRRHRPAPVAEGEREVS